MNNIIHKPLITEKSLSLAAKGWYTFAVDPNINRIQISDAVEKFYKVHVINIRTISMHGKTRKVGKRMMTTRLQNWKKALVRLKDGEKIAAFEVTQEAVPASKQESKTTT